MLNHELKNCGHKMVAQDGRILFCVSLFGKPFYGVMTSTGERSFFVHELKRGKYLNHQEWDYAIEKWDGPDGKKVYPTKMSTEELAAANMLALFMARDFTYGMTEAQKLALPNGHVSNLASARMGRNHPKSFRRA